MCVTISKLYCNNQVCLTTSKICLENSKLCMFCNIWTWVNIVKLFTSHWELFENIVMVSTVNQSTKVLKKEHCSVKFGHLKGFFNSSTCSPRTMATMHCPLLQSTIRHCAHLGNILVAGAPIFSQKLISNIRCKYSSIIFIIT